ncbi:VOC family protein [Paraburkholderia sp. Ac-20347]|jgi:glyoxylase I family protein|uniref:VOC family protein n=1 Tax=Paraburkholderia sp. Ac-20347 TaxID=2703892 RepID=UPI00197DCE23|nr:VOC family protein [Paraburkholderia sp. Ac-20347]MBN3811022.1 VOC family protein [Paraburkholderia sp. Ac-20347]
MSNLSSPIECRWDHLQLCSADAEATAAWFARCLNAEIVRRPGRVDLRIGGIDLFITPLAPAQIQSSEPRTRREGIDHFGVTVDDIDAAFAHLTRCEAQIVEPVRQIRPGVRACFVRAPGEVLVEVLERRPAEMTFR